MSLTLHEARDRALLISDVHTRVHLDLTHRDAFEVSATLTFSCARPGASTFLELGNALEVRVDGQTVDYDGRRIALADLAAQNEVTVEARMPYVTDGDGMTVTLDPADDERYVCAYTAMDIAQKVIPCFDQPDLKSTFSVSVTAPAHWSVLANGALEYRDGDTWRFTTTPPISTYLFFVCGGPFVSRTWEEPYDDQTLAFGWHARASQARELDRDFDELRRITSTCFQHYTSVFDAPYAFADYQQVFAPGLNWSAMEFPGCVVFRDELLPSGTPTAVQQANLASTIAHEMAHMWFGDLVTMRWWEDSWLNESFADYMGYEIADVAAGYRDAWTVAAIQRKPAGYRADLRRSTHPVAEDAERLVDVDTAFTNFDMITYAKGAGVLRQLAFWLGPEEFLAGVNSHLSAHAFGNATLADFLGALDAVTERDVRSWAEAWLRTPGFDTIEVTREGDVPVLTRRGTRPHRFTVAAYDDQLVHVDTATVDLAGEPVRLEAFAGLVVVPNAGDETFAAIVPDARSWSAITTRLGSVADPLTRAMLWWTAVSMAESQLTSVDALVDLAILHLPTEQHPVVFEGVATAVRRVVRRWGDQATTPAHLDALAALGHHVMSNDAGPRLPAAERLLASCSRDAPMLGAWLARDGVDQEVRWLVVERLAALGDPSHIESESGRDRSVAGHHGALAARAAIATPEAKAQAWQSLMSGELGSHEWAAVASGFWGLEQADLVEPYIERYLSEGMVLARRSGQAMSDVIGDGFPWLPWDHDARLTLRAETARTLTGDVPTVLARAWQDHLDDLDRTL